MGHFRRTHHWALDGDLGKNKIAEYKNVISDDNLGVFLP